MKTLKQEAISALNILLDTASIDDIMYKLYVIDKVHKGKEDVEAGRIFNSAEVRILLV
jgi:hypothetical protein